MGSHSKAAVAVAAHEVKTTEVHGVGESTVCSETEAADLVTFETLNTNEDVGSGATQVAQGNHTHTLIATEELAPTEWLVKTGTWEEVATVTISGLKKIVIWAQAFCILQSDYSQNGYIRVFVDDVEKLQVMVAVRVDSDKEYGVSEHYSGPPGVVKIEVKGANSLTTVGGRCGIYSIGV